ncbi:hypothetical protein [Bacillus sp. CGMCC 1.16541]|uniref:hypothetical protein n=1 Tax=Bacillus sp. CGMCC 1.16541 TaxID=2185143 RepID=UPI000D73C16E|nr:hypothetical protein [Bacillus sp. CGMCC 1.16541]
MSIGGSTLVYNNQRDPLFVSMNSTVTSPTVVTPVAQMAAMEGNFYSVTTGRESVAANGFLSIQLTMPANSNRTIYVQTVFGGATTNTTVDLLFNATFAAAGTAITPVNTNSGSTNTSAIVGKYISQATDPTTGGTLFSSIIQTGGTVTEIYDGAVVVPSTTSDRTLYTRLTNNTNQVNILAITITYWELISQ